MLLMKLESKRNSLFLQLAHYLAKLTINSVKEKKKLFLSIVQRWELKT